jgi:hypothetical protein
MRIIEPLYNNKLSMLIYEECKASGILSQLPEVQKWQKCGWRCGYFGVFVLLVAAHSGVQVLDDVRIVKMPTGFVELIWVILEGSRKRHPVSLTSDQRRSVLRGENVLLIANQILDEMINLNITVSACVQNACRGGRLRKRRVA